MGSVQEKFALIQQASADSAADFTITELCNIYGVSRSSYYSWLSAEETRASREAKDRADFELILSAYLEGGRKKGAKAIHMTLLHRPEPVVMNLKKIRRLMKKYGLECPIRKANPYRRMAKALKTNNVADNLVQRQFEQYGPRMILLTDITYIPYNGKHAYLSTILDAYTKQILAYSISDNLQVDFVLDTVRKLLKNHGNQISGDTIIHSDQGCHYTSYSFRDLLKNSKLRQSMSRKGNCWDNAPQESFFGHMKDEIKPYLKECKTYEEVRQLLASQIDYYNNRRYQWKLAKLSPNEFYEYIQTGIYPLPTAKSRGCKEMKTANPSGGQLTQLDRGSLPPED